MNKTEVFQLYRKKKIFFAVKMFCIEYIKLQRAE